MQMKIIIVACMLYNFIWDCIGGKDQLWPDIEREKGTKIDSEIQKNKAWNNCTWAATKYL